jgi:hypothetical protein
MIVNVEQRWQGGGARWVAPSGGVFEPSRYRVDEVSESAAKAFICAHHYSASYPAARYRVGLFDVADGGALVGVCVFSVPMSQAVLTRYADLGDAREGVELGRLVLLGDVAFNAESWFVSRALKQVREAKGVRFVLSYSDPVERRAASGEIVKPGHVGTIYQALNARFMGRSSSRVLLLSPSGVCVSPRALSKIRNGEVGARYAEGQLREAGAPPREAGEGGAQYVSRVLGGGLFQRLAHPGNLAYGWALERGRKGEALFNLPALPYVRIGAP